MNKIFSVLVFLLSALLLVQTAPQFDNLKLLSGENFKLDGLKSCIDQLSVKVPKVKECYDKFDKNNPSIAYDCVKEKFKSIADSKTVNECIPESFKKLSRNLTPK